MTSVTRNGNGGQARLEKLYERHGRDFFSRIGKRGGRGLVSKYGREHMAEIGRKGGLTTSELYDAEQIGALIVAGQVAAQSKRERAA